MYLCINLFHRYEDISFALRDFSLLFKDDGCRSYFLRKWSTNPDVDTGMVGVAAVTGFLAKERPYTLRVAIKKKKKTFCKVEMCLILLGVPHTDRSGLLLVLVHRQPSCARQRLLWIPGLWASDSSLLGGLYCCPDRVLLWSVVFLAAAQASFSHFFLDSFEHLHWLPPPLAQGPRLRTPAEDQALPWPDGCSGAWPHWKYLTLATHQSRGKQTSCKGPESKYIRRVGHPVSVTSVQVCCAVIVLQQP